MLILDAIVDGSNYQLDHDLALGVNCSSYLHYDALRGGLWFDVKLGTCGMRNSVQTVGRSDFIGFSQTLSIVRKEPLKVLVNRINLVNCVGFSDNFKLSQDISFLEVLVLYKSKTFYFTKWCAVPSM